MIFVLQPSESGVGGGAGVGAPGGFTWDGVADRTVAFGPSAALARSAQSAVGDIEEQRENTLRSTASAKAGRGTPVAAFISP